jgi:DNA-directed RNA polymerase subunit E'/Rpb7
MYLQDVVIQQDDEIRLRIVGTRVDANDIFAVGTLMEDYLGMNLIVVKLALLLFIIM